MKRLLAVALLSCALPAPAEAADKPPFLTFTVSEIGRPVQPMDGACLFASGAGFSGTAAKMFDAALEAAVRGLGTLAERVGADVLIDMRVTPVFVPNPIDPRNVFMFSGVHVCGTLAKYLPTTTASAQ